MWLLKNAEDVTVLSNRPADAILNFLVRDHADATIYHTTRDSDHSAFAALVNATVEVHGESTVVEVDEFGEEGQEPTKVQVTIPGPITVEPAGNVWAIEGDSVVVRSKTGDELLTIPLVLAYPIPVDEPIADEAV